MNMPESPAPEIVQHTTTRDHDRVNVPSTPKAIRPDLEKEVVVEPEPVQDQDQDPSLLPPGNDDESLLPVLDKWNEPKVNRIRYLATVVGLVIMGLHDAAIGALIPYVRQSILPKVKAYWHIIRRP